MVRQLCPSPETEMISLSLSGLLLGGVVIADLVKPETAGAVRKLHNMGLQVVLVTGDNRRTAHALAEEVSHMIFYDIIL